MADSSEYIEIALKLLNCNQKELAAKLGVSPAQVTKWKQGEKMSAEMQHRIITLADLDPNYEHVASLTKLIALTGSIECAQAWVGLIEYLSDNLATETDIKFLCGTVVDAKFTVPESHAPVVEPRYLWGELLDDDYVVSEQVVGLLTSVGLDLTAFPSQFNLEWVNYESELRKDYDDILRIIESIPMLDLIQHMLATYYIVRDWVSTYIEPTLEALADSVPLGNKVVVDFYGSLMPIALTKLPWEGLSCVPDTPDFAKAMMHAETVSASNVKRLKLLVAEAGLPFLAEYNDLVTLHRGHLEEDSLRTPLSNTPDEGHPDIYQNELLRKTRENNAMLRLVCEKLGVSEGDVYNQLNSL